MDDGIPQRHTPTCRVSQKNMIPFTTQHQTHLPLISIVICHILWCNGKCLLPKIITGWFELKNQNKLKIKLIAMTSLRPHKKVRVLCIY